MQEGPDASLHTVRRGACHSRPCWCISTLRTRSDPTKIAGMPESTGAHPSAIAATTWFRIPGRSPVGHGAAFTRAGIVLLLAPRANRSWQQWLVRASMAGVGMIGVLGFVGFWLNADLLFPEYPFAGVALHSTLGLMVLAAGLYLFVKRQGWSTQSWLA